MEAVPGRDWKAFGMKKEIRVVDEARGVCQITTLGERWYAKPYNEPVGGLPSYEYRPSVTFIVAFFPKSKGFENWLKRNGDDADTIRDLAADYGYIVHRAVAQLNAGEAVRMWDKFQDHDEHERELTPDEYYAVKTYADWWHEEGSDQFEILGFEWTIWPDAQALASIYGCSAEVFEYAGTGDIKVRRKADNTVGIIDCKTSLDIWPSMEMQVAAYRVAEQADWGAILQLNYRRNKKKKWKLTMLEDRFELFKATKAVWKFETEGAAPLQRDMPLELKL
jgi:hypothetical protein